MQKKIFKNALNQKSSTKLLVIKCCKDSKIALKTEIGHTVHELGELLIYVTEEIVLLMNRKSDFSF